MHCPACASTRLTSIQIRLAPDEDHTFASCQSCEWKGWFKEGADVPLGAGTAMLVPRGAVRSVTAGAASLRYLTVHAAREPLTVAARGSVDV